MFEAVFCWFKRTGLRIADQFSLHGHRFFEAIGALVHIESPRGSGGHIDIHSLVATSQIGDQNRLLAHRDSRQSIQTLPIGGDLDCRTRNRQPGARQCFTRGRSVTRPRPRPKTL